jgi:hypothetical protein
MRNGKLTETEDGRVFDDWGHEVYYDFFFQAWLWKYSDVSVTFSDVDPRIRAMLFGLEETS